ncbi:hypothetical protein Tco_0818432 [Tanacetum coccineum]
MAVKRIRKLFDDYGSDDDILSAVYRPSKISCFEKGCYSNGGGYVNVESEYTDDEEEDEDAASYLVDEFMSFVEEFSCEEFSCDKVVCLEDEKRRGYVVDEYTDDEAKYSRYWDEREDSDDEDYDDEAATDSDDEAAAYLVEDFLSFVDEFISCDKVHSVKEGCMDEKSSCYVNDEYSEDEVEYSRYWDEDYCTEQLKEVVM